MRVIERETAVATPRYKIARAVGFVAGLFAFVLCTLILINNSQLRTADPMNNKVLDGMKATLTPATDNPELIEEIRELDRLSRRAYFSAEDFNHKGIVIMLGALVVMVASLKYAGSLAQEDPYPDPTTPKRDLVAEAHVARNTFTAGALLVGGFLLATALVWDSPLDQALPVEAGPGASLSGDAGAAEMAKASVESEAPRAALPQPTDEELLNNWPSFLGAAHGFAQGADLPQDWAAEGAIQWKAEIPLPGFGSPIIWGGSVFLPGGSKQSREVYCFDAKSGDLSWRYSVSSLPDAPGVVPKVNDDTGYAAATMATEGNYVFAIFATGALVALDMEGELIWSRQLGVPDNPYGYASSLVIGGDQLYVQYDQQSDAQLLALDLRDGKTRWEVKREFGASWSTPLLINHDGQQQLVVAAPSAVVAYDPGDGHEIWNVECLSGAEVACRPVYSDGFVYASADYASVVAIDLSTSSIAWEYSDLIPGVSTPLLVGDYLMGGLTEGGIICLNAKTGEEVWYEMTDDGFYASPVMVGKNVYLLDRFGAMHIFEPGPQFKAIASPSLGEEATCTPAFIDGAMFIRGPKHLFRIGS